MGSAWCDIGGMKLNARKAKTMILSTVTLINDWRSVLRAASQRPDILMKSWRVFHDRSLLLRCFRCFAQPVLEYCSAVWCTAADTHIKLPDRVVSGARFQTEGVFECDIAHRRSLAELCILYMIRGRTTCSACASAGDTRCSGLTSVYLCASSLQNLTVPQDLHSSLSVNVELSC